MSSHSRWVDIRDQFVDEIGGAEAATAARAELRNGVIGPRLAELRRTRGLTQQDIAERMSVTKGRVSQIEQVQISGTDVLARYASALGGRLHQAIYFDDGDIAAIA